MIILTKKRQKQIESKVVDTVKMVAIRAAVVGFVVGLVVARATVGTLEEAEEGATE